MSQTFDFNDMGIGVVSLGDDINQLGLLSFEKLIRDDIQTWFSDYFDYYTISFKTSFKNGVKPKDLFIATSKSGIVSGIILIIVENRNDLLDKLQDVYGKASVSSISSVNGLRNRTRYFWKLENGTSLFLNQSGSFHELNYYTSSLSSIIPGVTLIKF